MKFLDQAKIYLQVEMVARVAVHSTARNLLNMAGLMAATADVVATSLSNVSKTSIPD